MKKSLKQYIQSKPQRTVVGTWTDGHSTTTIEVAGITGFDFIILDGEHGFSDNPSYVNLIRAAEAADIMPIVRVPGSWDEASFKRFLDAGASGVLVPNVDTKEDAEKAVRYSKFAPIGKRGCCPFYRSNDFGEKYGHTDYYQKSNEEVTTMLLIESKEGVDNFKEIASVPGVDAVLIGRVDLASSMGFPGDYENPIVNDAIEYVLKTSLDSNLITGMYCFNSDDCQRWLKKGIHFVTGGTDRLLLLQAYKKVLKEIRQEA